MSEPKSAATSLPFGPLGEGCFHLCVDMQLLFYADTAWHTPWIKRVLPRVEKLVSHHPQSTVFTRFIPAQRVGEGEGVWKRYYKHWASMTLDNLEKDMVELIPALAKYVPPAKVIDKWVYSPWMEGQLDILLAENRIHTLIITGGETDVCVLSTVLGAVDRGYRVILVTDALCSSSDQSHDASMEVYHRRYTQQVETVDTETVLANWHEPRHP